MIGTAILHDGIYVEVLSEVKNHDYGSQCRWRVHITERGRPGKIAKNGKRGRASSPTLAQINDSQIREWIQKPVSRTSMIPVKSDDPNEKRRIKIKTYADIPISKPKPIDKNLAEFLAVKYTRVK